MVRGTAKRRAVGKSRGGRHPKAADHANEEKSNVQTRGGWGVGVWFWVCFLGLCKTEKRCSRKKEGSVEGQGRGAR